MKVICIDANNQAHDGTPNVIEGFVYTVISESASKLSWILEDLNRGYCYCPIIKIFEVGGYKKDRFIPLSNIDELELINNKELVQ